MAEADQTTQAIQERFEAWGRAWNEGDITTYLDGYWDSEQTRYINNGQVIQGKAAIAALYRTRFVSSEAMGTLALKRLEITSIGEQDALVLGIWQLTREATSHTGAFTAHMRCIDGVWYMLSDHTSG